jgi:hypothetical protein
VWESLRWFFGEQLHASWMESVVGVFAVLAALGIAVRGNRIHRKEVDAQARTRASRVVADSRLQRTAEGTWRATIHAFGAEQFLESQVVALDHVEHIELLTTGGEAPIGRFSPDWRRRDSDPPQVLDHMTPSIHGGSKSVETTGQAFDPMHPAAHARVTICYTDVEGQRWQRRGKELPTKVTDRQARRFRRKTKRMAAAIAEQKRVEERRQVVLMEARARK